ncbi:hypothetical protein BJ741DRAFT_244716 [Chytriomyces cf. hyalinus JEL632]|nr:hypothetical protein BJ741DRAFT_244716 [Chytriomyces cf. hyalinus JEL632]
MTNLLTDKATNTSSSTPDQNAGELNNTNISNKTQGVIPTKTQLARMSSSALQTLATSLGYNSSGWTKAISKMMILQHQASLKVVPSQLKEPISKSQLHRMKKSDLVTLLQPSLSAEIMSKNNLIQIINSTPGLVSLKVTKTKQERNKISNAANNPINNSINNPINHPTTNPIQNLRNNSKRDHKKIYARKQALIAAKSTSKKSECQSADDTVFSSADPIEPKLLLEAFQHPNLAFALRLNMAGTGHTALSDDVLAKELESVIQTDKSLDTCLKNYNNALNAGGSLMSCAACGFTDIEIHADHIITSAQANETKSTPRLKSFIVVELTDYLLSLYKFCTDRYTLFKKTPVEYQAGFTCYKEPNRDINTPSSPSKEHASTSIYKPEDEMDITFDTDLIGNDYQEKLYNLHAHCTHLDTNDNKVYARFCTSCHEAHRKGRTYKYAVANGYDFGNLPALLQSAGIESISLIEQLLCQNVILFYRIIKLTPSGLTSSVQRLSGHVIATKIDSKKV